MPPPASPAVSRHFSPGRQSKAPDKAPEKTSAEAAGSLLTGSAVDDTIEATPTSDARTTSPRQQKPEGDIESNRMSFSSLYSLASNVYNGARGFSGPSSVAGSDSDGKRLSPTSSCRTDDGPVKVEGASPGATTAMSSISITTSSHNGSLEPKVSPAELLLSKDKPRSMPSALHTSTAPQLGHPSRNRQESARRSRSRTTTQRRISTGASSSPGSRESLPKKGVIGICALESKARSRPARNIFGKLIEDFELHIFGDKIILDEDVENWPVCDFLISFFSDGFPLDKAIAYTRLRKPFCVNDLPMQQVLWDRRLCLRILDKLSVPTPARVEVNRDGGPRLQTAEFARSLYDRTGVRLSGRDDGTGGGMPVAQMVEALDDNDTLCVDGVRLTKPFVEKPVSGEDHNINIYFPKKLGGGGRKLFRKINNKSSEKDDKMNVPRCITDPGSSYIYEQFLMVENAEDVKAYTVGPNFCHAETRKSPVVDGLVKRNPNGKEVRYVTRLTREEAIMASKIAERFGQRVCGFDLLRVGDKSYVIDVNGWSFVKDNESYYDKAAEILKSMFFKEIQRRERKDGMSVPADVLESPTDNAYGPARKSTGGPRAALRGIFKTPSMSRLTGHSAHSRSQRSSNHPPSPEVSVSSTPMTASPSLERSSDSPMLRAGPTLEPDSVLRPHGADNAVGADVQTSQMEEQVKLPPPASKAQWKLKGVVSVIRHADRTPKQKFKYTFHTKPFVDLLRGHQEEVLLVGEAALASVAEAVKLALEQGEEDPKKLRELKVYLDKKGAWPGTKVQIKPMFRRRRKEESPPDVFGDSPPGTRRSETAAAPTSPSANVKDAGRMEKRSDSMSGVTLSRISAFENNLVLDKLQLIIKWGGEPTHSARYQSQDLGTNFRNDLLLLNREVLDDVSIFSSSERRVTTSAQIFAAAFLNQKEFPTDHIEIRKDLLDDSNAAKDEMDRVKKKLKPLLREGCKAPPQFAWPEDVPEPYVVVRQVVDLMKFHQKVMDHNLKRLASGAVSSLSALSGSEASIAGGGNALSQATAANSVQARWCCGEGPELFKERWEKLFKEFGDADKVDPSKISELYDTMKFDALHNRQFLEWVFTPDASLLDEDATADLAGKPPSPHPQSAVEPSPKVEKDAVASSRPAERGNIAQRMGFRRRSEVALKSMVPATYPHMSYFTLYTGIGGDSAASKSKVDARLVRLREMYRLCKVLFDYIGPQEYGIDNGEKLEIGLLTSLPLLMEIVEDLEELQASDAPKSFFYFTKESHIYTLLNCILEGGISTKIERNAIPELDYLSQIVFELYESQNATPADAPNSFNYSIRITLSPGCHAFAPLDVYVCLDCRPARERANVLPPPPPPPQPARLEAHHRLRAAPQPHRAPRLEAGARDAARPVPHRQAAQDLRRRQSVREGARRLWRRR